MQENRLLIAFSNLQSAPPRSPLETFSPNHLSNQIKRSHYFRMEFRIFMHVRRLLSTIFYHKLPAPHSLHQLRFKQLQTSMNICKVSNSNAKRWAKNSESERTPTTWTLTTSTIYCIRPPSFSFLICCLKAPKICSSLLFLFVCALPPKNSSPCHINDVLPCWALLITSNCFSASAP